MNKPNFEQLLRDIKRVRAEEEDRAAIDSLHEAEEREFRGADLMNGSDE